MPFRKPSVVLFIVLALFTVFSLISAQSDLPLPLPSELDAGSAQFQDRASVELLTNGSFEVDLDGDKLPDGWKAKNTDVVKSDKLKCNKPDKVVAYSGNCAFQFSGNPTGEESKLSQDIAAIESIIKGSTLTLSAYVDPKSGAAGSKIASLKVKLSDSSKLKLDLRLPSADSIASYTQFTNTTPIMLPGGVFITEAKLDLKYGEVNGKYLIDDVSLTVSIPEPTATPVTPTEISPTVVQPTNTDVSTDNPTSTESMTPTSTISETPSASPTGTMTPTITPTATSTATATSTPTNTSTPIPTLTALTQLLANDGQGSDSFGRSVQLSGDGMTAIIGAPMDQVSGNSQQGSAYVFTRNGSQWTQQQKLVAADGTTQNFFGTSVSLSTDGNTALIGANFRRVNNNDTQGAAYIFVRSGGVWTQQQRLVADDGAAADFFGNSVMLSGDGSTAIIGTSQHDVAGKANQGAAYVYVRSGSVWTQQQKLVSSDGAANDNFGVSVSLSTDGSTAFIGAYNDDGIYNDQGSAYVFIRSGGVWTQQQQLTASDGQWSQRFGNSVRLSGDGNTAVVGAAESSVYRGSAYVYVRSGGVWTQQQKLVASDGVSQDYFGRSVAISTDGNTVTVSAVDDDVNGQEDQGSAYLYQRTSGVWTQVWQITSSDGIEDDHFGNSVSLNGDGSIVLVGVSSDKVGNNAGQGSAWVYSIPTLPATASPTPTFTSTASPTTTSTWTPTSTATSPQSPTPTSPPIQIVPNASTSNGASFPPVSLSMDGNTAILGAPEDAIGNNEYQGSAFIYVRSGESWSYQARLIVSDGETGDFFGSAVSLSADGNTAIVSAPLDDFGSVTNGGSVYVFIRNGSDWTLQRQLFSSDIATLDRFGCSVSVSMDGNTLTIGAFSDDVGANTDQGSAYVFVRNGSIWAQQAKLTASDGRLSDSFGSPVSISGDGNTVVVGAVYNENSNGSRGSAYVYVRSGEIWTQQARLTASNGRVDDSFGASLSISADGNTAIIGRPYEDITEDSYQAGAAYLFMRSNGVWTQQARLIPSDPGPEERFGSAVSLSADGNTAIVSEPYDEFTGSSGEGSAHVYKRINGIWTRLTRLMFVVDGRRFGHSVSLNGNGSTAIVSSTDLDFVSYVDRISAWVFELPSNP